MVERSNHTLREKLGIKPGMRIYIHDAPPDVLHQLGDLDDDTTIVHEPVLANFFLYFLSTPSQLFTIAETLQHMPGPDQIVWISWPKKVSKTATEITEQDLRDALLPIGMVDTKAALINDTYSSLKFVWRKSR